MEAAKWGGLGYIAWLTVIMACRRAALDHLWDPGHPVVLGDQLDLEGLLTPARRVVLGVLADPQNIQPMLEKVLLR